MYKIKLKVDLVLLGLDFWNVVMLQSLKLKPIFLEMRELIWIWLIKMTKNCFNRVKVWVKSRLDCGANSLWPYILSSSQKWSSEFCIFLLFKIHMCTCKLTFLHFANSHPDVRAYIEVEISQDGPFTATWKVKNLFWDTNCPPDVREYMRGKKSQAGPFTSPWKGHTGHGAKKGLYSGWVLDEL